MESESRGFCPDEIRLRPSDQTNDWAHRDQSELASDVEEDTPFPVRHHGSGNLHTVGRRPGHVFHKILDSSSNAHGQPPSTYYNTGNFRYEEDRLDTFRNWNSQIVRKEDLARNGFVYTGTGDKVRCFSCNIVLHSWDPGDDVEAEHRRHSPNCPFLRALHSSPSAQGPQRSEGASACRATYSSEPQNVSMTLETQRLQSFTGWSKQMTQKPEQMAKCGLYYTGNGDRVYCFHCGVLLYNWEPNDDPFREHARWFPDCQYLQLLMGEQFMEDVKSNKPTADPKSNKPAEDVKTNKPTEEDPMESPAMEAMLFSGYTRSTVQKAVDSLKEKKVEGDKITAALLLSMIMEMEEQPSTSYPVTASASSTSLTSAAEARSEEFMALERHNESLREKQQCKICMDCDVDIVFYPCKHLVCCASCASSVTECPICRGTIQSREKIFLV